MERQMGVRGLADAVIEERPVGQLDRIGSLIDWSKLAAIVKDIHGSEKGRPSYPSLMLVKALLLAQWYRLSDPDLEEALSDRMSFRRFVGLAMADPTPDHVTLWRFRDELVKHKRHEQLLKEVERQFTERKLIVKQGTLIDATLLDAQAAKPGRPIGARSRVDPDADWTRQYGRSTFGYKAHLAVDLDALLIRKAVLTSAKVYESQVADELIGWDEGAVYADKAYEHKERRAKLKAQGITDHIMHRNHKYQSELPDWQKAHNAAIAPVRRRVEHIFGTLKRCYGYTRVRYFNLERNAVQLTLMAMALNLRRGLVLVQ